MALQNFKGINKKPQSLMRMCARDAGAGRRARIACYEYTIACYYYYYYLFLNIFIYYIQGVAG